MGGRVAMRIAADHPADVAALVVVDMDARAKEYDYDAEASAASTFGRAFPTPAAASAALERAGYGADRVASWVRGGARIAEQPDGSCWSSISPRARDLARARILGSNDGLRAWAALAGGGGPPFPVHLFRSSAADTVCVAHGAGGVDDMKGRLPALRLREFPRAHHSIHSSAAKPEFLAALDEIVRDADAEGWQGAQQRIARLD